MQPSGHGLRGGEVVVRLLLLDFRQQAHRERPQVADAAGRAQPQGVDAQPAIGRDRQLGLDRGVVLGLQFQHLNAGRVEQQLLGVAQPGTVDRTTSTCGSPLEARWA